MGNVTRKEAMAQVATCKATVEETVAMLATTIRERVKDQDKANALVDNLEGKATRIERAMVDFKFIARRTTR